MMMTMMMMMMMVMMVMILFNLLLIVINLYRHDYLSVHNGSSLAFPLLGKFCGSRSPFSVMSTVSSLFMMFNSDSSIVFRGFNATYELLGKLGCSSFIVSLYMLNIEHISPSVQCGANCILILLTKPRNFVNFWPLLPDFKISTDTARQRQMKFSHMNALAGPANFLKTNMLFLLMPIGHLTGGKYDMVPRARPARLNVNPFKLSIAKLACLLFRASTLL